MSEVGELVLQQVDDPAGLSGRTLRVLHADPHILISDEIYSLLKQGEHHPSVSCEDGLLTIRAENEIVRYRIGDWDPQARAHRAELLTRTYDPKPCPYCLPEDRPDTHCGPVTHADGSTSWWCGVKGRKAG